MRAASRWTARAVVAPAARRLRAKGRDDGFALLESIVAVTLITIVMAAIGTFYVRAVGSSNVARARQVAVHVADGVLDGLRSYPASDLVSGRGQTASTNQFSAAPSVVAPWLQTMAPAYDHAAAPSAGADVTLPMPTIAVPQSPVNKITYNVMKYLGTCQVPKGANSANCTSTNNGVTYYRAVVSVSWANARCGGTCYYVTSTLFTTDPDPTFNLNQLPRPAPLIVNPGAQNSQVGDVISLQLAVQDDTGAPPYTWGSTSTFPVGLTMSATGLITGTTNTPVGPLSIIVTVTDAFLKTTTATFTWTVVAKLAIAGAPQTAMTSTTGGPITPLALTASGGTGTPYAWSDPQTTLPPGLTISATTGQISGTPTLPGAYQVQLQLKDAGAIHTVSVTWMWNVYDPLVLTNPGDQATVVSTTMNPLTLATSGGSGSVTWSLSGALPAGITFNAGRFTGTPTALGTYPLTVTLTDSALAPPKTAAFTWYVVPPLVISGGANQISTVGTAVLGLTLTASGGGGSPYTWTDPNATLPAGLALSTTATYQGKVTGTPTTPGVYAVQLKTTDVRGVVMWTSFTWTVYAPLGLASPGNQSSTVTTAITPLQLAASGGSGSYTWSGGASLPAGLSMSATGRITGTPTGTGSSAVSITITDTVTLLTKTVSFTWLVAPKPTVTSPGNQTTTTTATIGTVQLTTSCQNAPCTYTLNNGPAGLSINATGAITGTVTSAAQNFAGVTVTVRDAAGITATSGTFSWNVLAPSTITSPGNRTTTVGASINITPVASCINSPCTYTLNNGPAGLSMNASGAITGTVALPAQTYSAASVTIRDNAGVATTSATFTWVVNPALTITSPGNQATYINTNVSIDLSALDGGGTAPYTYSATGLPGWLSVNATTGILSGKTPATRGTFTGIVVKVSDTAGVTAASASFSWTVNDLKLAFGDQVNTPSASVNVDLDNFTTGGTAPYTFTIVNKPSWLTYSTLNHTLIGTAPFTAGNYSNIIITVGDSAGQSVTNAAITWHVSTIAWTTTFGSRTGKVGNAVTSLAAGNFDSGGVAPITFWAAALPPGLSINPTTGLVSGTPTVAGTYFVTLTITDSLGAWANSNTFSWTISP